MKPRFEARSLGIRHTPADAETEAQPLRTILLLAKLSVFLGEIQGRVIYNPKP